MNLGRHSFIYLIAVGVLTHSSFAQQPQQLSKLDRDRAKSMLEQVANDVRKHYYDPNLHGVNWDATVQEFKAKIEKAESNGRAFSEIAAALDTLKDSHTFFLSPQRANRRDYGWQMQMVGDRCFVVRVRPSSDAETKGLKPGDEVLSINGFQPTRENFWKMEYVFNILRPQPSLRLVYREPSGAEHQSDLIAKITELKRQTDLTTGTDFWDVLREEESAEHRMRIRFAEFGDDLIIVKFPEFAFTQSEIYDLLGKIRKRHSLLLDLRGNPGGSVETLQQFLGGMFENEVKIGDRVGREAHKPQVTKPHGHDPFTGKLVVLVDSKSASAAELFGRVVQLEKRGVVIGDHSSGSVMEAKHYSYKMGTDVVVFYGASITDADIIMADGKSLEHTGVTPDEVLLPTGQDLASDRDPVLAHAAETLGVKLTPEQAGKLFPYEWAPQ